MQPTVIFLCSITFQIRYDVLKAGLMLLSEHAQLFSTFMVAEASEVKDLLLTACKCIVLLALLSQILLTLTLVYPVAHRYCIF